MSFDQNKFNRFVLDNKLIGFFEKPITLKSGRLSWWYVNWRTVVEDAYHTKELVQFVLEFVKDKNLQPDTFYGVPEGATKLGILTQMTWAQAQPNFTPGSHTLAMGRGKPKDHGDPKDKFFVGMPKGKVVVLEDVTTTGGSLLTTVDALQQSGIEIIAAIGLTNRNEKRDDGKSVADALKEKGVLYFAMSNAKDLLRQMKKEGKTTDIQWGEAIKYFQEFGVDAL